MTEKYTLDETVEDVELKTELVREAAAEEHSLSAWQAIASHKRIVFWCIFFAFSGVGWWVPHLYWLSTVY